MTQYEERIPQIKQQPPRRKANRKLLVLLTLFFLTVLIVLFVRSPYSKVSQIEVSGNEIYTNDQVLGASGLKIGMQFFNVWESQVQENEQKLPGIKSVTINREFPGVVHIQVSEHRRVAFVMSADGKQSLLLENGILLPEPRTDGRIVDRPLVRGWNLPELMEPLAHSLSQLPLSVLSEISEIALTPTEHDKQRITLYMRDGNQVRTVIHFLADRLPWYPSIAKQLPEGEKGIVFMLESTWFSQYGSEENPEASPGEDGVGDGTGETTGSQTTDAASAADGAQAPADGQTEQSGKKITFE